MAAHPKGREGASCGRFAGDRAWSSFQGQTALEEARPHQKDQVVELLVVEYGEIEPLRLGAQRSGDPANGDGAGDRRAAGCYRSPRPALLPVGPRPRTAASVIPVCGRVR
jgi:hypothetical protein